MKKKKNVTLFNMIYAVLRARPFCDCSKKEKGLYGAYCLRVAETVQGMAQEQYKRHLGLIP